MDHLFGAACWPTRVRQTTAPSSPRRPSGPDPLSGLEPFLVCTASRLPPLPPRRRRRRRRHALELLAQSEVIEAINAEDSLCLATDWRPARAVPWTTRSGTDRRLGARYGRLSALPPAVWRRRLSLHPTATEPRPGSATGGSGRRR